MSNKTWTTFKGENGEEFFLNLNTGEVDEGFTVQLHLRTGSKYKIISPERQAYLKRKREKYLKKVNSQRFYVAHTAEMAEFLLSNGAELVKVYRDSFCNKKEYLFRDSDKLQGLINEYFDNQTEKSN